jgi:pimeloyl-ACP methyl ester carboxylesterase
MKSLIAPASAIAAALTAFLAAAAVSNKSQASGSQAAGAQARGPQASGSRAGVAQSSRFRARGAAAAAVTLRVGGVVLHACGAAGAYCGDLDRLFDPDDASAGSIRVHFEFYRHAGAAKSAGTLVATEGGPGYPATLSREDYLALFKPLMRERDVLMMDNRGTGQSGAVDCHELQTGEQWTIESVAHCGETLGGRAPLYSTAYAADDLAAVVQALGLGKIDLYGDSYGTYFEQVFAVRHPEVLRSIVLDGAYPLTAPEYAWYPTYAPAMREKFNLACARSPACAELPGNSLDHIQPTLEELRRAPIEARAYDIDAHAHRFLADATRLAIVMLGGAPAFTTVRETDAAARAFALGDRLPLERLMAETIAAVDSRDPGANQMQWSAGLAAAVLCQDPPQIFDMRLPPALRLQDRDAALALRRQSAPDTYAPFTIDEFRAMPLDYSFLDECVGWPVAPAAHPASQVGANAEYPDVPALVISGEFDSITTLADGARVAAAFPHGLQVRIANSFHVNALPRARSDCAAQIVRRFIDTLAPGDTSCAAQVPPLRLVPHFTTVARDLDPATAVAGNSATLRQLKIVSAALYTTGDVLARVDANSSGHGVGLRGGTWRLKRGAAGVRIDLNAVRWTRDVAVSGTLLRTPGRRGTVRASLGVTTPAEAAAHLTVQWTEGVDQPRIHVRGSFGRTPVAAEAPAP